MERPSLFTWFPRSRRWIETTWHEAGRLCVDHGYEAAYGLQPPAHRGITCADAPILWRMYAWMCFVDAVTADPAGRHRSGTLVAKN